MSTDFATQKDSHGKVVYENGQTLDRRKKKLPKREDGVIETGHYGSVRKAKSIEVQEFNVNHDEPLSFSITDAINKVEEQRAGLGPLWQMLRDAVCDNMKPTEIGYSHGKTDPQASAVGNVILAIAIEEAARIYSRLDQQEASDSYVEWLETQDDAMAVPARKLKRALNPVKSPGLVFRQNKIDKSLFSAANDNDSRWLNEPSDLAA